MNEELRNEKWSWGDRYLKYRAETTPCSSILDFKSATQILTENSTKKWIEMENDWSRASTKFRRQINTVDDEIKKEKCPWGGRYFKYHPPPFYIELQTGDQWRSLP